MFVFHVFCFVFLNRRRSWTSASVSAFARKPKCLKDYSTRTSCASTITGRWRWPSASISSSWQSSWRPALLKRNILFFIRFSSKVFFIIIQEKLLTHLPLCLYFYKGYWDYHLIGLLFVFVTPKKVSASFQEDQLEGTQVVVPPDSQGPLLFALTHPVHHPSRSQGTMRTQFPPPFPISP